MAKTWKPSLTELGALEVVYNSAFRFCIRERSWDELTLTRVVQIMDSWKDDYTPWSRRMHADQ